MSSILWFHFPSRAHQALGIQFKTKTPGNCMSYLDLAVGASENFYVTSQQITVVVFWCYEKGDQIK